MSVHSYHVFYFPFRWLVKGDERKTFSEQVNLDHIPVGRFSMWERVQLDDKEQKTSGTEREMQDARELFGERQYYFDFVHSVLYDMKGREDSLIYHYERREPKERVVNYLIQVKKRTYRLRVDAINLNLYSTGVGVLSFYLANEEQGQDAESIIRDINQFGRRIMPPHSGEFNLDFRRMCAHSITIEGLDGKPDAYVDCFDYKENSKNGERGLHSIWKPAVFIESLIKDLSPELEVVPVIDDRMLVNCWYGNEELSSEVKKCAKDENDNFIQGDFWYKYVFVDAGDEESDETCRNQIMKKNLLKASTYFRWQKEGTLYGVSRYSLVVLTDRSWFAENILAMHMRTIYSRMFELIIVQRASMLRFSGEVTKVSALKGANNREVALQIGSLYKEYIRFVNQIYFRSVTVQDQGIELYDMLTNQFASNDQIKDLDDEIGELYQYITLMVDQSRNENGEKLNLMAAIFLPATVLAGLFGMNRMCELETQFDFWMHIGVIVVISVIVYWIIKKWRR